MAVYVDEVKEYPAEVMDPAARRYGRLWSHMLADTTEELLDVAARIGLRREWLQQTSRLTGARLMPHFDLTPPKRLAAIRLGALPLTRDVYRRLRSEFMASGRGIPG